MITIINAGTETLSVAEFIKFIKHLITSMGKAAMTAAFPGAATIVTDLGTALVALEQAVELGNAMGGAEARETKRAAVVELVETLALYLEGVSHDRTLLVQTGFPLHKIAERDHTPTGMPENVKAKTTGLPGEAKLSASAVRQARSYEARATQDIQNGPFVTCPSSTSIRGLHFTGLERGKDWFFQIRAIGPNGVGPWSDPAMMMVV